MDKKLLGELIKSGAKVTVEDIVFITRDKTGQIVWLEKGNSDAGLEHIVLRHAKDFENAVGILVGDIPSFLENVITNGEVVFNDIDSDRKNVGYTKIYEYNDKKYILTGVGLNGFLVSAYPVKGE